MPSILFLGATGYIGATVFNTLLNAHPAFDYTALVRFPEHVAHITGINCVQGSQDDLEKVKELSAQADVVINVANSDELPFVEAIIAGLKKRSEGRRVVGTLIHTSGLKVFLEGKDGSSNPEGKLWDDGDEGCIKSISPSQPHGPVDRAVLAAGSGGEVRTYIICPGAVYGQGATSKVSGLYKSLIEDALKSQMASIVGKGSSTIGMVHVRDLSTLYLLILNSVVFTPVPPSSPYSRYYIAVSQERDWKTVVSFIAQSLNSKGLLPSGDARSIAGSSETPISSLLGATARIRARRAQEDLGWEPEEKEWEHFAEWDIERCLSQLEVRYEAR